MANTYLLGALGNPFESGFSCCQCPTKDDFTYADVTPTNPVQYVHTCTCPSADVIYTGEQRTPSLCGFEEYHSGSFNMANGLTFNMPRSVPHRYFLEKRSEWTEYTERIYECDPFDWGCGSWLSGQRSLSSGLELHSKYLSIINMNEAIEDAQDDTQVEFDIAEDYNICNSPDDFQGNTCKLSSNSIYYDPSGTEQADINNTCSGGCFSQTTVTKDRYEDCEEETVTKNLCISRDHGITHMPSNTKIEHRSDEQSDFDEGEPSWCSGTEYYSRHRWNEQLFNEDTDELALARAKKTVFDQRDPSTYENEDGVPVFDSSWEKSTWEIRTTDKYYVKTETSYTICVNNLTLGKKYKGCVRIQRRVAYRGEYPDNIYVGFLDIEPDLINEFTATEGMLNDIKNDGFHELNNTPISLPHEQGWEYRVKSVDIWSSNADCDCPNYPTLSPYDVQSSNNPEGTKLPNGDTAPPYEGL